MSTQNKQYDVVHVADSDSTNFVKSPDAISPRFFVRYLTILLIVITVIAAVEGAYIYSNSNNGHYTGGDEYSEERRLWRTKCTIEEMREFAHTYWRLADLSLEFSALPEAGANFLAFMTEHVPYTITLAGFTENMLITDFQVWMDMSARYFMQDTSVHVTGMYVSTGNDNEIVGHVTGYGGKGDPVKWNNWVHYDMMTFAFNEDTQKCLLANQVSDHINLVSQVCPESCTEEPEEAPEEPPAED
jgi:hypothetical protein